MCETQLKVTSTFATHLLRVENLSSLNQNGERKINKASCVDPGDWRRLAALLRDPDTGETLGGMIGKTSYGLLFIDLVYLPEDVRGQDIGSRLLAMMEQEGIARGCKSGFLFTVTFQAPAFYARHGWTEFGRIACDPPGTARIFMTKTLSEPQG
ncbi:MAG TPA: GNAT family N-acetyltransferase [Rhodopila sp.]